MVAVELLVREGKMTRRECQLLSVDLGGLESQLDSKLTEDRGLGGNAIPAWISRKVSAIDGAVTHAIVSCLGEREGGQLHCHWVSVIIPTVLVCMLFCHYIPCPPFI